MSVTRLYLTHSQSFGKHVRGEVCAREDGKGEKGVDSLLPPPPVLVTLPHL